MTRSFGFCCTYLGRFQLFSHSKSILYHCCTTSGKNMISQKVSGCIFGAKPQRITLNHTNVLSYSKTRERFTWNSVVVLFQSLKTWHFPNDTLNVFSEGPSFPCLHTRSNGSWILWQHWIAPWPLSNVRSSCLRPFSDSAVTSKFLRCPRSKRASWDSYSSSRGNLAEPCVFSQGSAWALYWWQNSPLFRFPYSMMLHLSLTPCHLPGRSHISIKQLLCDIEPLHWSDLSYLLNLSLFSCPSFALCLYQVSFFSLPHKYCGHVWALPVLFPTCYPFLRHLFLLLLLLLCFHFWPPYGTWSSWARDQIRAAAET